MREKKLHAQQNSRIKCVCIELMLNEMARAITYHSEPLQMAKICAKQLQSNKNNISYKLNYIDKAIAKKIDNVIEFLLKYLNKTAQYGLVVEFLWMFDDVLKTFHC